MKVYLQWAKAVPEAWEQVEVTNNAQVRRFARKQEPVGGEVLDQQPGWLVAANIQGVVVEGWDHVGLEVDQATDKVTLSCWNDDPDDWPVGHRWGVVWTFLPLAPDFTLPPPLTGVMNTRQTSTVYSEDDEHGPHQPWAAFPFPDTRNVFHGIWVEQALWDAHHAVQAPHEWMEWGTG